MVEETRGSSLESIVDREDWHTHGKGGVAKLVWKSESRGRGGEKVRVWKRAGGREE